MRRIGLILAFKGTNYGALLQAFATQTIIESLGFETEILDYRMKTKLEILPRFFSRGFIKHYILSKMKEKNYRELSKHEQQNERFKRNREERVNISKDFRDRRLQRIKVLTGLKSLKKEAETLSAVIVGSDQKWTPGACYGMIDSLRFVPKGVRRVSYATSLGVSEYPDYCKYSSRKMWEKIDFLSVREQQGANIIKEICGDNIKVSVVLDPTYLITKDEWLELIHAREMLNEKYLFCYFLGNDIESKKCARRYAENKGLKLVSLCSSESFSEIDYSYADHLVYGASPEDFVNWIRGAECIFTDSFHGTAFSIINQKQFYVFYRKRDDVEMSRNSRIDDILETWQIKERLIKDKDRDWKSFNETIINYGEMTNILSEKRLESISFLQKALTF